MADSQIPQTSENIVPFRRPDMPTPESIELPEGMFWSILASGQHEPDGEAQDSTQSARSMVRLAGREGFPPDYMALGLAIACLVQTCERLEAEVAALKGGGAT